LVTPARGGGGRARDFIVQLTRFGRPPEPSGRPPSFRCRTWKTLCR